MTTVFGVPLPAILGQLMLGLVNGSFYALLSLGLAVIFGLLGVVNFAHGAFYMLGAFAAYIGLASFGVNYWWALLLAPLTVGLLGIVIERLFLRHLYQVEPVYGLLLTFGIALIAEGVMRSQFGASGKSYPVPPLLQGGFNLGFMVLPIYRAWVILASVTVCFVTWFLIERTRLGSRLRAATENAKLVQAFGINVPLLVMCTYGAGVALAALAGVLAAPGRAGQSLDGLLAGHRGVRRGGHRRHGLDHRRHRQRTGSRTDRRTDESHLSRGLEYRGLRHHGSGAHLAAGRPVRQRAIDARATLSCTWYWLLWR